MKQYLNIANLSCLQSHVLTFCFVWVDPDFFSLCLYRSLARLVDSTVPKHAMLAPSIVATQQKSQNKPRDNVNFRVKLSFYVYSNDSDPIDHGCANIPSWPTVLGIQGLFSSMYWSSSRRHLSRLPSRIPNLEFRILLVSPNHLSLHFPHNC